MNSQLSGDGMEYKEFLIHLAFKITKTGYEIPFFPVRTANTDADKDTEKMHN